jgi:NAD(P)-dependent dehydrogenase (short-subunit alcohol dehydrogenase family)
VTSAAHPRLAGKSGVVTGSGGGVGRGIALALARAGANVVLAARRAETGKTVAAEIASLDRRGSGRGLWVRCDVTHRADMENAVAASVAEFGALDFMIHNATSARSPEVHALEDVTPELWEEHCSVSLRGSFHAAQASLPELERRRGLLVLLTSPAGIEGSATLPLYAAVKAGQRALVKSLAREWGPLGVRVNAVSPLAVTPALTAAYRENPELEARLEAITPLGRVGDPEQDIGEAVALLVDDAAGYITGQTWVVDGGRFTGL